MAAPLRPALALAFGREKWAFVPAVADVNAPTVAEVTAATGLDLSCFLYESSARPSASTSMVELPRLICDTYSYENPGATKITGGEARFAVDPQGATNSTGKKAWEKLPAGTTGFLVARFGIDVNTDFAAGQFVSVYPVKFGAPLVVKEGDGEGATVAFISTFGITGPVSQLVAIAA